jgi:LuxR family maltose regulon positive regulatory protein
LHHTQILLTHGDIAGATALLNQATQLSQQAINPALIAMTTAVQAQIALASDEADKAISWAAQFLDPANVPEQETVCQTLAQIWLIQNRPDAIQQLMARLLATAVPSQNIRLIIRWQIAQALGHAAQQQPDEAVAHLAQAVQLGQAGGFMRSYLDWGQPCFNLLNQLAQTKGEVELETAVKRLLIAFREAGYQSQELPHLTPREQDVLQLIAAGLSNDDIAAELVVAKGTVKKHLDNIYGKLEVNSRTQALARAQELTLL